MRKYFIFIVMIFVVAMSSVCFAENYEVRSVNITVEVPSGFKVLNYTNNNKDLVDVLNSVRKNKQSKEQYIKEFREQGVVFYAYDFNIFTDISIISHTPNEAIKFFEPIFNGEKDITPEFIELSKKFFMETAGVAINDVVLRNYNNVRYLEITTKKDNMYIKGYITKYGDKVLTYMLQTPPQSINSTVPMFINFLEKVIYKGAVTNKKIFEQESAKRNTMSDEIKLNNNLKSISFASLYEGLKGLILAGIGAAIYKLYNSWRNK